MSGGENAEQELQSNIGYDEKIQFLVTATGEIKQISKMIGTEVDEQLIMLNQTSDKMDSVNEKLTKFNKDLKELTHSKQGPLMLISIILTIVLIVLVLFVVL